MAGFGRTGEWFAADLYDVVPDLMTFAKGVNSGYVPLGGVAISGGDRRDLREAPLPRRASPTPGTRWPAPPPSRRSTSWRRRASSRTRPGSGADVVGPALRELAERHP